MSGSNVHFVVKRLATVLREDF